MRWIGNEAGGSREEGWGVVPRVIMTTERNLGYWRQIDIVPNSTRTDIGSRGFIRQYDEADVARLSEMGNEIKRIFSRSQLANASAADGNGRDAGAVLNKDRGQFYEAASEELPVIEIHLAGEKEVNLVTIKETIEFGQHIEEFCLEIPAAGGFQEIYRAATVGYQRICRFPAVHTQVLRFRVLKARGKTSLTEIGIYYDDKQGNL